MEHNGLDIQYLTQLEILVKEHFCPEYFGLREINSSSGSSGSEAWCIVAEHALYATTHLCKKTPFPHEFGYFYF